MFKIIVFKKKPALWNQASQRQPSPSSSLIDKPKYGNEHHPSMDLVHLLKIKSGYAVVTILKVVSQVISQIIRFLLQ